MPILTKKRNQDTIVTTFDKLYMYGVRYDTNINKKTKSIYTISTYDKLYIHGVRYDTGIKTKKITIYIYTYTISIYRTYIQKNESIYI